MKRQLLQFIAALRDADLSITASESLDAVRAAGIVGIERAPLREALAAALVKDEADRPTFLRIFDRHFAVPGRQRGKGERPQPAAEGSGRGAGKGEAVPSPGNESQRQRQQTTPRREPPPHAEADRHHHRRGTEPGDRLAHRRLLQARPFADLSASEIEECTLLVAELGRRFRAHVCRRQRRAHRGRLDIRRTIRHAMGTGGVPLVPIFRERQPGRPDLLALCDYSHSVATATHFLLALLAPAHAFFRRVRSFAFIDRPVEVTFEAGTLIPHESLDLYARSDFGKVLVDVWNHHQQLLTRNTILLILGDARNNRRPPRADLLARMRHSVRQAIWLNPEPVGRWNTGDSVIATYQRDCDALLAAGTVRQLFGALRRTFHGVSTGP